MVYAKFNRITHQCPNRDSRPRVIVNATTNELDSNEENDQ